MFKVTFTILQYTKYIELTDKKILFRTILQNGVTKRKNEQSIVFVQSMARHRKSGYIENPNIEIAIGN